MARSKRIPTQVRPSVMYQQVTATRNTITEHNSAGDAQVMAATTTHIPFEASDETQNEHLDDNDDNDDSALFPQLAFKRIIRLMFLGLEAKVGISPQALRVLHVISESFIANLVDDMVSKAMSDGRNYLKAEDFPAQLHESLQEHLLRIKDESDLGVE